MKFIIIFGPQAVWKMTVGHELEKTTWLKLFHNHMTIELVAPFFGYWEEFPIGSKLVHHFREKIFEEFAKTNNEWMIFTYLWAFDRQDDWNYIKKICNIFETKGADIFFVELEANIEKRIERNKTPHRLNHKPTKRNIARSENDLIKWLNRHRLNSKDGEIKHKNYIRIDNTNINAKEVAKIIKNKFNF